MSSFKRFLFLGSGEVAEQAFRVMKRFGCYIIAADHKTTREKILS
jgi:formate-dependent phosphoribosylglycinamide formyltransferase (GAR transformylase)